MDQEGNTTTVPSSDPDSETPPGNLHAVWGADLNSVFSVGEGGAIYSFDGTVWEAMESPTTDDLNAVWGTGASNVYAVGEDSTILHYDGLAWSVVSVPNISPASLELVSGTGPNDIFVAGSGGVLLHFNGTGWGPVNGPQGRTNGIAASAHGVFIFGEDSTTEGNIRLLRSTPW